MAMKKTAKKAVAKTPTKKVDTKKYGWIFSSDLCYDASAVSLDEVEDEILEFVDDANGYGDVIIFEVVKRVRVERAAKLVESN